MALRGLKVIELAGLAPAPFCGSILADFGAQVIKIDKHSGNLDFDVLSHGKKSIALNLKHPKGVQILKQLTDESDVLIEPFRRGVMEKLGLGPDIMMASNPKLVYARLTGYGQSGPMADRAGHDINYVATSGLLSILGRAPEPPCPPINMLADFAGGGLSCALGILMALFERAQSGKGQIVDSSMVEGAAYVGSWIFRGQSLPVWSKPQGQNLFDSGSHMYDTYRTKDDKFMAVGSLEPQFYMQLLEGLGISHDDAPQFPDTLEEATKIKQMFSKCFASKTRDEWTQIFEDTDACVTPVLTMQEAYIHPHNKHRNVFTKDCEGVIVPNPAPKLNRTPARSVASGKNRTQIGEHTVHILQELGFSEQDIKGLQNDGVIACVETKSKL